MLGAGATREAGENAARPGRSPSRLPSTKKKKKRGTRGVRIRKKKRNRTNRGRFPGKKKKKRATGFLQAFSEWLRLKKRASPNSRERKKKGGA